MGLRKLRAYLPGPDVFHAKAIEIGNEKKCICAEFGFVGVFPLDADFDLSGLAPSDQGHRCFDLMVELMDSCDLAIANLTPFRGPSMDVGTAIEIGYMHGREKPVFGYTNVPTDFAERVDDVGFFVEPFGLIDNLMVEGPIYKTGVAVVRASVPESERYTSLAAFRDCVRLAAGHFQGKG